MKIYFTNCKCHKDFLIMIFQTLQKYGSKDLNRGRNRYHNILPYDFNRVKLITGDNDYINASYVSGYKNDEEYIICQGPTADTVDNHWQMILEHNIKEVIQLTPFFDNFQVVKVNFLTLRRRLRTKLILCRATRIFCKIPI